jgi:hypothetical protein
MDADLLAGLETAGEAAHKRSKGLRIGRELMVGNGVVEKPHAKLFSHERFFGQLQHLYLLFTEQRNEGVDTGALKMDQFAAQAAAAAGAQDNSQGHGRQRCGRRRRGGERCGSIAI